MTRRLLAALFIAWALGFVWFSVTLPGPAAPVRTDAVIVATGASGRIARGVDILRSGLARQMLVTGVDVEVKRKEFAAEYKVEEQWMRCCVLLDYTALDTRGNARATARWIRENRFGSVRLVTSDWHMRRTAAEVRHRLDGHVTIVEDGVSTQPSIRILLLEYNKFLVGGFTNLWF